MISDEWRSQGTDYLLLKREAQNWISFTRMPVVCWLPWFTQIAKMHVIFKNFDKEAILEILKKYFRKQNFTLFCLQYITYLKQKRLWDN